MLSNVKYYNNLFKSGVYGMTQCKVPAGPVLDGAANTASMPDLLHHDLAKVGQPGQNRHPDDV